MKIKHRRIYFILFLLVMVGLAVGLTLYGLRDGVSYFYSPTDVKMGKADKVRIFRLGGVVKNNSAKKNSGGIDFVVTDFVNEMAVSYHGLPPSLFRENSGVIATGHLVKGDDGTTIFVANEILAKHDENYMPPEVVKKLKESGEWRDDGTGNNSGQGQLNNNDKKNSGGEVTW
ncbi:MAG: cytochrome c maturation protein CcmE [Hydrotalea sp.]|nr:cytochrome c maturation protein CcmE [Hydrotalea sp.]